LRVGKIEDANFKVIVRMTLLFYDCNIPGVIWRYDIGAVDPSEAAQRVQIIICSKDGLP